MPTGSRTAMLRRKLPRQKPTGCGDATTIDDRDSARFPWAPMIAISACLLTHTVAVTSLSTYMGVCVQHLMGLASLDMAGYYASWLLSAFTIGSLLSSYAWGMFADRFGRKPVMIVSISATGVFAITFGLSKTFASAVASRFLYGLAISIIPIARIMAVELLGPKHAVIGIVFLPGSKALGTIIGPALGGQLAQPAVFHPSMFSSTGLFARYPFLLPNLVVALLAVASLPVVLFFLPETLTIERGGAVGGKRIVNDSSIDLSRLAEDGAVGSEYDGSDSGIMLVDSRGSMRSQPECACSPRDLCNLSRSPFGGAAPAAAKPHSNISSSGSGDGKGLVNRNSNKDPAALLLSGTGHRRKYSGEEDGGDDSPRHQRRSGNAAEGSGSPLFGPGGLLSPWRVRVLLLLQGLVAMIDVGFYMMYPLWLLASTDKGGLQWSVPKIGKVLGWSGVGSALVQFVVYPALVQTIGIIWLLRSSGVFCAMLFLAAPDVQRLPWSENASCVVGVVIAVLISSCTSVVETAMNLASANAVPAKMRGKIGGVFAVAGALGRVVGPAALSSLLAWSLDATPASGRGNNMLVDYHAVFVVLMGLMVVLTVLGWKALTLESLTVPIENRHGAEYESVSQSSREADTPIGSSDSLAEAATTASRAENGQRRRDPAAA